MIADFVPYLAFDGTCEAAFNFYAKALGGEILMMRYSEMPGAAPAGGNGVAHARLRLGERFLMGGDAMPGTSANPHGFSVALQISEPGEAERAFMALAEGARITMPLGPTLFAERFGLLIDEFGAPWMVNCEKAGRAHAPQA